MLENIKNRRQQLIIFYKLYGGCSIHKINQFMVSSIFINIYILNDTIQTEK